MDIRYPSRIRLARIPTPIEFCPRLTEAFGGPHIFVKRDDLTGSVLSGNKVRKLEFSIAEALREKAQVIITAGGIQSNHCRATALACARLGLECHLVLRGSRSRTPDGNLLLDYLAGARFSFFPREVYSTRKPEIVADLIERYAKQGKRAYYIPVGASNAIGTWGYVRAFEEILTQAERMKLAIHHIVTAVGSGGTMAGLLAGQLLTRRKNVRIWGVNVCDDAQTFITEIRRILEEMNDRFHTRFRTSSVAVNILDGYVGEGYAIPYEEELKLIAFAARAEGLVFDPVYTGKALYGLREEIRKGRFRKNENVLYIHTGGVFGLFPQRDVIASVLRETIE